MKTRSELVDEYGRLDFALGQGPGGKSPGEDAEREAKAERMREIRRILHRSHAKIMDEVRKRFPK